MTVYGIWFGGASYSNDESDEHVEEFANITSAVEALRSRRDSGYGVRQRFDFVNQEPMSVFCPTVENDSKIHLYLALDTDEDGRVLLHGNGPDKVVRFGPRGGVVVENRS